MIIRSLAGGIAVALLCCTPAAAAPVTVNLRLEGSTQTYFEGPITTDAKNVTTASGGTHKCDGTNGGVNPTPGPTMTTALDDAAIASGFTWDGTYNAGFDDFFVERIGSDGGGPFTGDFWNLALNRVATFTGGCQTRVATGDRVLMTWQDGNRPNLELSAAAGTVSTGQPLAVTVSQHDANGALTPAAGAAVQGQTAATDGTATIAFDSPGVKRFKATKAGAIRSNAVEVCVEDPGSGACTGFISSLGRSSDGAGDKTKPRGRLTSARSGQRFRRGPRLLKGIARDEAGLKDVRLRLNWVGERGCQYFEGSLERFSKRSSCKKTTFFSVGDDQVWSYLLPERLRPGRYTLTLKIVDRANNSTVQRVRFTVLG